MLACNDDDALYAVHLQTKYPRRRSDSDSDFDGDISPGGSQLSDLVTHFFRSLTTSISNGDTHETRVLYESTFNKLTERFFKNSYWPSIDQASVYIDSDVVCCLYKELYYRHVYSKLSPDFEDRLQSWLNYSCLFDYIIKSELEDEDEREFPMNLPVQWVWDMLDEFVYQFTTYAGFVSKAVKAGKQDDIKQIGENMDIWDAKKVLWYLHQFVAVTDIRAYLQDIQGCAGSVNTAAGVLNAFNSKFARNIGYFAIVGLARVHTLLGDYHGALKAIEGIDYSERKSSAAKNLFCQVPACHATVFYYMGFAYMMMRRYRDAISTFSQILLFLDKTTEFITSHHYQSDNVSKKMDQMFALLLISHSLSPCQLDESLMTHIKEKHHEKQLRLSKGELLCYEELFNYSCPKFVSPAVVEPGTLHEKINSDAFYRQLRLFLAEVRQQQKIPNIQSYLKLYTAISIPKLANFLDTDDESLITLMLCAKHKQHQFVRNSNTDHLSATQSSCSAVDFSINREMIHVTTIESKQKYAEVFLRHIHQYADILTAVNKAPKV